MSNPPQKDYAAAFAALQCQYGFGGHPTPSVEAKKGKWYRRGESRSSSTASLIRPAPRSDAAPPPPPPPTQQPISSGGTLSESELRLGKLMAEYGFGSSSGARFDRK